MRFLILLILLTSLAHAETDRFDYKISHRKSMLELNWDGKVLKVKDRTVQFSIPYKDCSRDFMNDFFSVNKVLWKDQPATSPDPVVVLKDGKKILVAASSRLGGHLLSLRDKMRLLSAMVAESCK